MTDFLGLDLGMKRSGIARASTKARLAEPLMTVETAKLVETLEKIAGESQVEAIVVGLPRTLQGGETPQSKWVGQWIDKAKARIKKPFYFHDESMSTKQAEDLKFKNEDVVGQDAVAAAIILQDFLDMSGGER